MDRRVWCSDESGGGGTDDSMRRNTRRGVLWRWTPNYMWFQVFHEATALRCATCGLAWTEGAFYAYVMVWVDVDSRGESSPVLRHACTGMVWPMALGWIEAWRTREMAICLMRCGSDVYSTELVAGSFVFYVSFSLCFDLILRMCVSFINWLFFTST